MSLRIERKRARLPHSERLICPTVIFTSHGAAAKAPIATSAMAAACRTDGLILSAIKIPTPIPIAVRVNVNSGSSGSCSAVFEMDMGKDIAYHYMARLKKEIGNFQLRTDTGFHRYPQSSHVRFICVNLWLKFF